MKKKLLTLMVALLGLGGVNAQQEWNFSDWEEQTITETTTKDGLTVAATSSANVVIESNTKAVDGITYSNRLKLGGAGTADSRNLSFEVDGACEIAIVLCSSNSDERTLNICAGTYNNTIGQLTIGGTATKEVYKYKGETTKIYLASTSGGINIYAIYVTPTEGGGESEEPGEGQDNQGGIFTCVLNEWLISTPVGFFTPSSKFNFGDKYRGEYNGITFTKGLKMESGTELSFTTTENSTVTIVQSTTTNDNNTIKFNGTELDIKTAETGTNCRIYTLNNVDAGENIISRGSGETGILYVKVEYTTESIEVKEDDGYCTFTCSNALDFTNSEELGLTAYAAILNSNGNIEFTPITGKVPAETGMLIKADGANTYRIPIAFDNPTEIENVFVGVTKDTDVEESIFILYSDETHELGFYKTADSFTVGAKTAYIPTSISYNLNRISYVAIPGGGNDGTTGLNAIEGVEQEDGKMYDLQGRQVTNPAKGLYIKNGKKYIVK